MAKNYREPADTGVNEHARSILDMELATDPETEVAAVARGRMLLVVDPGPKRVVGFDKEAKPIERPRLIELREGQRFEASKSEVKRLRELGYLFDPAKVATDADAAKFDKYGEPVVGSGGVGFVNAGQG